MFDDIFGGGGGAAFDRSSDGGRRGHACKRVRRPRGTDLELTLEDVLTGVKPTIEFTALNHVCRHAAAAAPSPAPIRRPARPAAATARSKQAGLGGLFRMVIATCPAPATARGKVVVDKCTACRGRGATPKKVAELNVKIPAGIEHGQAVRIAGEGEPGDTTAPRGDLHRGHPRQARTTCSPATATTCSCRCRSRSRKPRSATTLEVPDDLGDQAVDAQDPAGTQHGATGSASRTGTACPTCGRRPRRPRRCRSRSRCPRSSPPSRNELAREV